MRQQLPQFHALQHQRERAAVPVGQIENGGPGQRARPGVGIEAERQQRRRSSRAKGTRQRS